MEDPLCSAGINMLQDIGLHPIIDTDLRIAFNDQQSISTDLCKIQNRCAIQGSGLYGTPPTLYIDGNSMGPINTLKVRNIKALAEPSPLQTKTVSNQNIQKPLEIKADRINLQMPYISELQKLAPMGHRISTKLNKLIIYENNGLFEGSSDDENKLCGDKYIGTLVICLPVPYKGGSLILYDDENELRVPFDELLIKDNNVPWIAFYTDVKHKVEVVNSGIRLALQLDLLVENLHSYEENALKSKIQVARYSADPDFKYYFQSYSQQVLNTIKSKLVQVFSKNKEKEFNMGIEVEEEDDLDLWSKLKIEFSSPDGVALMLKRSYGVVSLSPDMLKGSDKVLYQALKDDFRVEVKTIILEQKSDESGNYYEHPIEVVEFQRLWK